MSEEFPPQIKPNGTALSVPTNYFHWVDLGAMNFVVFANIGAIYFSHQAVKKLPRFGWNNKMKFFLSIFLIACSLLSLIGIFNAASGHQPYMFGTNNCATERTELKHLNSGYTALKIVADLCIMICVFERGIDTILRYKCYFLFLFILLLCTHTPIILFAGKNNMKDIENKTIGTNCFGWAPLKPGTRFTSSFGYLILAQLFTCQFAIPLIQFNTCFKEDNLSEEDRLQARETGSILAYLLFLIGSSCGSNIVYFLVARLLNLEDYPARNSILHLYMTGSTCIFCVLWFYIVDQKRVKHREAQEERKEAIGDSHGPQQNPLEPIKVLMAL